MDRNTEEVLEHLLETPFENEIWDSSLEKCGLWKAEPLMSYCELISNVNGSSDGKEQEVTTQQMPAEEPTKPTVEPSARSPDIRPRLEPNPTPTHQTTPASSPHSLPQPTQTQPIPQTTQNSQLPQQILTQIPNSSHIYPLQNQDALVKSLNYNPPVVPYPFVPFWTACPLPFDPRTYPISILPPQVQTSLASKVGKDEKSTPTPKEEKIAKYRLKRIKRNFNRPVDQQRSLIAQSKGRDEKGKFVDNNTLGNKVEQYLKLQVEELRLRLAASESESRLLQEKLIYMEQELQLLKNQTRTFLEKEPVTENTKDKPQTVSSPISANVGNFSSGQDCYSAKIDFSKVQLRKTASGSALGGDTATTSPKKTSEAHVSLSNTKK